jgi:hypothetical protein
LRKREKEKKMILKEMAKVLEKKNKMVLRIKSVIEEASKRNVVGDDYREDKKYGIDEVRKLLTPKDLCKKMEKFITGVYEQFGEKNPEAWKSADEEEAGEAFTEYKGGYLKDLVKGNHSEKDMVHWLLISSIFKRENEVWKDPRTVYVRRQLPSISCLRFMATKIKGVKNEYRERIVRKVEKMFNQDYWLRQLYEAKATLLMARGLLAKKRIVMTKKYYVISEENARVFNIEMGSWQEANAVKWNRLRQKLLGEVMKIQIIHRKAEGWTPEFIKKHVEKEIRVKKNEDSKEGDIGLTEAELKRISEKIYGRGLYDSTEGPVSVIKKLDHCLKEGFTEYKLFANGQTIFFSEFPTAREFFEKMASSLLGDLTGVLSERFEKKTKSKVVQGIRVSEKKADTLLMRLEVIGSSNGEESVERVGWRQYNHCGVMVRDTNFIEMPLESHRRDDAEKGVALRIFGLLSQEQKMLLGEGLTYEIGDGKKYKIFRARLEKSKRLVRVLRNAGLCLWNCTESRGSRKWQRANVIEGVNRQFRNSWVYLSQRGKHVLEGEMQRLRKELVTIDYECFIEENPVIGKWKLLNKNRNDGKWAREELVNSLASLTEPSDILYACKTLKLKDGLLERTAGLLGDPDLVIKDPGVAAELLDYGIECFFEKRRFDDQKGVKMEAAMSSIVLSKIWSVFFKRKKLSREYMKAFSQYGDLTKGLENSDTMTVGFKNAPDLNDAVGDVEDVEKAIRSWLGKPKQVSKRKVLLVDSGFFLGMEKRGFVVCRGASLRVSIDNLGYFRVENYDELENLVEFLKTLGGEREYMRNYDSWNANEMADMWTSYCDADGGCYGENVETIKMFEDCRVFELGILLSLSESRVKLDMLEEKFMDEEEKTDTGYSTELCEVFNEEKRVLVENCKKALMGEVNERISEMEKEVERVKKRNTLRRPIVKFCLDFYRDLRNVVLEGSSLMEMAGLNNKVSGFKFASEDMEHFKLVWADFMNTKRELYHVTWSRHDRRIETASIYRVLNFSLLSKKGKEQMEEDLANGKELIHEIFKIKYREKDTILLAKNWKNTRVMTPFPSAIGVELVATDVVTKAVILDMRKAGPIGSIVVNESIEKTRWRMGLMEEETIECTMKYEALNHELLRYNAIIAKRGLDEGGKGKEFEMNTIETSKLVSIRSKQAKRYPIVKAHHMKALNPMSFESNILVLSNSKRPKLMTRDRISEISFDWNAGKFQSVHYGCEIEDLSELLERVIVETGKMGCFDDTTEAIKTIHESEIMCGAEGGDYIVEIGKGSGIESIRRRKGSKRWSRGTGSVGRVEIRISLDILGEKSILLTSEGEVCDFLLLGYEGERILLKEEPMKDRSFLDKVEAKTLDDVVREIVICRDIPAVYKETEDKRRERLEHDMRKVLHWSAELTDTSEPTAAEASEMKEIARYKGIEEGGRTRTYKIEERGFNEVLGMEEALEFIIAATDRGELCTTLKKRKRLEKCNKMRIETGRTERSVIGEGAPSEYGVSKPTIVKCSGAECKGQKRKKMDLVAVAEIGDEDDEMASAIGKACEAVRSSILSGEAGEGCTKARRGEGAEFYLFEGDVVDGLECARKLSGEELRRVRRMQETIIEAAKEWERSVGKKDEPKKRMIPAPYVSIRGLMAGGEEGASTTCKISRDFVRGTYSKCDLLREVAKGGGGSWLHEIERKADMTEVSLRKNIKESGVTWRDVDFKGDNSPQGLENMCRNLGFKVSFCPEDDGCKSNMRWVTRATLKPFHNWGDLNFCINIYGNPGTKKESKNSTCFMAIDFLDQLFEDWRFP